MREYLRQIEYLALASLARAIERGQPRAAGCGPQGACIDAVLREPNEFMPEVEIAGVIRGKRVGPAETRDPAVVYVPMAQTPAAHTKVIVLAQTSAAAVVASMRAAVHSVDADLPLGEVAMLERERVRSLSSASCPACLIGVFAAIAAPLAGIGLYGVISHTVSQRRRDRDPHGAGRAFGCPCRDQQLVPMNSCFESGPASIRRTMRSSPFG